MSDDTKAIKERAGQLAVQTLKRLYEYPADPVPGYAKRRIIAEEFEKELEVHATVCRKMDTMLGSLQEDFEQLDFPIEAWILAAFRDEMKK